MTEEKFTWKPGQIEVRPRPKDFPRKTRETELYYENKVYDATKPMATVKPKTGEGWY
jgi:hypothetical protein